MPEVKQTVALLVWGGDVLYLTHWMRQSGLADMLPRPEKTVYVGISWWQHCGNALQLRCGVGPAVRARRQ